MDKSHLRQRLVAAAVALVAIAAFPSAAWAPGGGCGRGCSLQKHASAGLTAGACLTDKALRRKCLAARHDCLARPNASRVCDADYGACCHRPASHAGGVHPGLQP